MKFLPEEKKKRVRSLVLLAISAAGIIYFNIFAGPAATKGPTPGQIEQAMRLGSAPSAAAPDGTPPVTSSPRTAGDRIDTSILESEDFRALRGTRELLVTPDELGKANPFGR